jgi:hypothetical protein
VRLLKRMADHVTRYLRFLVPNRLLSFRFDLVPLFGGDEPGKMPNVRRGNDDALVVKTRCTRKQSAACCTTGWRRRRLRFLKYSLRQSASMNGQPVAAETAIQYHRA